MHYVHIQLVGQPTVHILFPQIGWTTNLKNTVNLVYAYYTLQAGQWCMVW